MAVKKEDAEALANECAQLTTGLPMGDPLLRKEREPFGDCALFGRRQDTQSTGGVCSGAHSMSFGPLARSTSHAHASTNADTSSRTRSTSAAVRMVKSP